MKLLADESIDRQIVERLRKDGHEVRYVAEQEPGLPDLLVLEQANAASAVLLTADKDFGELIFREKRVTSGVLLIRIAGLNSWHKAEIVSDSCRKHGSEFQGCFSVVSPAGTRIHDKF